MRNLAPMLGAALLLAGPSAAQTGPASFTPEQRAAIVEILRDALRSDPSILADAIAALQAREMAEEAARGRAAIAANAEALFRDPADPALGAARPEITLVEFSDYRCPYCKRMQPVIADLLESMPGLRVVVKEIPILGPASVTAARAALAAQAQGKFAAFRDALMRLRGEPDEATVLQIAAELGLDQARFRRDMASEAVTRRLGANLALAQALGIQGTPAFVAGEKLFPGVVPGDQLREALLAAR
jgi:protein-disulfide isomerase